MCILYGIAARRTDGNLPGFEKIIGDSYTLGNYILFPSKDYALMYREREKLDSSVYKVFAVEVSVTKEIKEGE